MPDLSYTIGVMVNTQRTEPGSKSIELIVNAIEELGHQACLIRPFEIDIVKDKRKTYLLDFEGKDVKKLNVLINRHNLGSLTDHDVQVVRELEIMNVPVVNKMNSTLIVHNKFLANQILIEYGIPFPSTASLKTVTNLNKTIRLLGGFPVILKASQSNQGKGVVIVHSKKSLRSLLDLLNDKSTEHYFLQSYIPEAAKNCPRALIIDQKLVCTYGRIPVKGEFRANIKDGKFGGFMKLTPREESTLLKIPKILNLEIVGIDFARTRNGIKIIEVNAYPGIGELYKKTKFNAAPFIVQSAVNKVRG